MLHTTFIVSTYYRVRIGIIPTYYRYSTYKRQKIRLLSSLVIFLFYEPFYPFCALRISTKISSIVNDIIDFKPSFLFFFLMLIMRSNLKVLNLLCSSISPNSHISASVQIVLVRLSLSRLVQKEKTFLSFYDLIVCLIT